MRTIHVEKERKFDGLTGTDLPALDGLPGVAEVSTADTEELDAVYYDTADLRLLAHGVTLRRRTGGHDSGWHLKLPVGPDERRELQLPLSAGGPGKVPRELKLRTRAYTRGEELAPLVHLRTHRRRTLLLDGKRRSLAEVAQDAVSAQVLGTGPGGRDSGAGASAWTEVEAELVEGRPELLDAVEQLLRRAGLRRSASQSKLARALDAEKPAAEAAKAAAKGVGKAAGKTAGRAGASADAPPGSIGAAVTALLREQSGDLLALDPAVRTDEPDAVHQMRVAVRRLRSTLKVHRRLLTGDSVDAVAEELRWLGAVLGEARDREVLGARLGSEIGRLPAEECPGPVREHVDAWATAQYRSSWKRAVATLDGERYFALLDSAEALAARPTNARARREAIPAFERTARREQRRVGRRLAEAAAAPAGPPRDQALHGARKAAKRARYAAEGAAPSAGKPATRLAVRMKAVQQLLGTRQDALLACQELPGLAAAAHSAGEPGFGYGVLYAGERAAIAQADRELPAAWKKARRRRLTRFT